MHTSSYPAVPWQDSQVSPSPPQTNEKYRALCSLCCERIRMLNMNLVEIMLVLYVINEIGPFFLLFSEEKYVFSI